MMEEKVIKGLELELTVTDLAFGGMGIARKDDFVFFIPQALPGQRVRVKVTRKKKKYAETRLLQVVEQSPYFVSPQCEHFYDCGGCLLQHLNYPIQLEFKRQQVIDSLERLGGMKGLEVEPTLASTDIFYYRNKMEFSFSRQRWLSQGDIASQQELVKTGLFLGLHARGFYEKVIDINKCWLLSEASNALIHFVRNFARSSDLAAYSTRDHEGFWRFLVVREGKMTGQTMVNIVTREFNARIMAEFAEQLVQQFPTIHCLVNNISASKSNVAFGENEMLLTGAPVIAERIGPFVFNVSANSFFQTNSRQAQKLYDLVAKLADLSGHEVVYDLFSGTGTIGIYLSGQARRIVGFEVIESAITDARQNAALNHVENCHFVHSDLMIALENAEELFRQFGRPEVMIIDPPRGGMHPKTVAGILRLAPERIIFVSCNPTTLARDLATLVKEDYDIGPIYPVDMFPHTAHIEVVMRLDRRSAQI